MTKVLSLVQRKSFADAGMDPQFLSPPPLRRSAATLTYAF